MRRKLLWLLPVICLLLAAVSFSAETDPTDQPIPIPPSAAAAATEATSVPDNTQETPVTHARDGVRLSLRIPEGWEYERVDADDDSAFGIRFRPAGQPEGGILLQYCDQPFLVCGTGLFQKDIRLGAYAACMGTYDSEDNVWSYIRLIGTPDSCVVLNDGADAWWATHGEEAMAILETIAITTTDEA